MTGPANGKSGDHSVNLLASAFVLTGGGLSVTLIIVIYAADPLMSLLKFFGAAAVVLSVVWLLRDKPKTDLLRQRYSGFLRRPQKTKVTVQIGRKTTDTKPDSQILPPTAKQVHELAEGINTWVPSGASAPPKKPVDRDDGRPQDEWRKIR